MARGSSFSKNLFKTFVRPTPRRSNRLTLERLEDRTTPATITAGAAPGGFETTNSPTSLALWLDASDIDGNGLPDAIANNTPLTSWVDKSGFARNMTNQNTVFYTAASGANNLPSTRYSNSRFLSTYNFDNLNANYTMFVVERYVGGDNERVASSDSHNWFLGLYGNQDQQAYFEGWVAQGNGNSNYLQFRTYSVVIGPGGTNGANFWADGAQKATNNTGYNPNNYKPGILSLGSGQNLGETSNAEVSEVIIINRKLNEAERRVIENALNAKYGNPELASADVYHGDDVANGNYDSNVIGIGRIDAANQLLSSGQAGFGIEASAIADDGDFVTAGHKTAINDFTTAGLPAGVLRRWTRNWYVDVTDTNNNLGATLSFDYSDAGLAIGASANSFKLLRSLDGGTTWTDVGAAFTRNGDQIKFNLTAAQLSTGLYTLGDSAPPILSLTASPFYYYVGQNSGAGVAIDPALTVVDPPAITPTVSGAKVSIPGFVNGDTDVLALSGTVNGFSGTFDAATGILTITGSGTSADIQAALRAVTYKKTAYQNTVSRTFLYHIDSNQGSVEATRSAVLSKDAPFNVTWDGGGDGISWSDPLNWDGDFLPDSNDIAVFANTDPGTVNVNGSFNVGGLSFTNTTGHFTLAQVSGGLSLYGLTAIADSSTSDDTISATLAIMQAGSFQKMSGGSTLTINGNFTGPFTANVSSGTLLLTAATTSLTSSTSFSANSGGTVKVLTTGANSGAGGATLTLNGGTLQVYSNSGTVAGAPANPLSLLADSTLSVDSSLTGVTLATLTAGSGGSKKLTVAATASQPVAFTGVVLNGTAEFSHVDTLSLSNVSGSGGLTQSGTGTMLLLTANTYTGSTTVSSGTLRLPTRTASAPVMTNMSAWYDASNASSIHLSGTTVTAWDDLSGNGHNTHVGGNTTTYSATGGPNGGPTVQFRNSWLDTTDTLQAKETFVVFKSAYNNGTTFGPDWGSPFGAVGDYSGSWMLQGNTTQFWGDGCCQPAAVSFNGNSISSSNPNGFYGLGSGVGQYFVLMVDGNSNNHASQYSLGRMNGWTNSYMDVAEVISYNQVLSASDQATVGQYLAGKYGVDTTYQAPPLDQIPDGGSVTVASGATFDLLDNRETVGGLTVASAGSVTVGARGSLTATGVSQLDGPVTMGTKSAFTTTAATTVNTTLSVPASGTLTLGSLTGTGTITLAAGSSFTENSATTTTFAGTINLGDLTTFTKSGAGDFNLSTPLVATNPVAGSSVTVNSTGAGALILTAGVHLQSSSINFGGSGPITVGAAIDSNLPTYSSPVATNMAAWFDASFPGSVVVNGSSQVTQWTDRSGNGHNATTGNGTVTYSATSGPSGMPSVQFVNSSLNISGNMLAAEEFIVLKSNYSTSAFGSDWGSPFGALNGQNWMIQGNTQQQWTDGSRFPVAVSANGIAKSSSNNFDLGLDVSNYFVLKVDANNWNQVNQTLYELGQNAGWQNGRYSISEVVVYSQILSAADQVKVQTYLANKYNVAPLKASLTKSGSGTLTLSAASTYDGSTTITGGQIVVGGSSYLPSTTSVSISGGGTLALGTTSNSVAGVQVTNGSITGTGTLTSATTFNLQGGTISVVLAGAGGLTKTTNATLTLSAVNTYAGNTTITAGTLNQTVAGAIPSGVGKGNVTVNGTLELHGFSTNVNGLSGNGMVRSTYPGPINFTIGGNDQSGSFGGVISDGLPPSNGFVAYTYYNNSNDDPLMNLSGNKTGSLYQGGAPALAPGYQYSTVVTSALQYTSGQFATAGITGANNQDNFQNLFLTTLHVSAAQAGSWNFRAGNIDDRAGIWIDLNHDGVFGTAGQGLGSGQGEQLVWGNDNRSVTLAAGDYVIALTFEEYSGGESVSYFFTPPNGTESVINPSAANQSGLWNVPLALVDPSAGAGGGTINLVKIGAGTETLGGTNVYSGTTTISGGTIKLDSGPTKNGLSSWFDASNAASVHRNGTTVTQWDDLSGNGHNAVTVTGTPTYSATGGPNGLPSIEVGNDNGNHGYLDMIGNVTVGQTYIVFKSGYGATAFGADWGSPIGPSNGDYGGGWMLQGNTTQFWDGTFPQAVTKNGVSVPQNNSNGSNFNLGGGVDQYMVLVVDSRSDFHSTAYSIGRMNGWQRGQFDISEIFTYDHVLTASEQNRVGAYLTAKYGLSTTYVTGNDTVIPDGSAITIAAGATFDVAGAKESVKSIAGPAGSFVTLSDPKGKLTFVGSGAAAFAGTISGSSPIVQAGLGAEILSGNNTYSGPVSIVSGTIEVDGAQTGAGTVSVTAAGVLTGTGTIPGAISVADPNSSAFASVDGAIDPGPAGGIGLLTVGSVTLNANVFTAGALNITLSGAASYDQLRAGSVTLGNVAANFLPTLNLNSAANLPVGDYLILDNTGGNYITGRFAGLAEGQLFTSNGLTFSITYIGGTGNDVVLHNFGGGGRIYVDPNFTPGSIADADPVASGAQPATFGVDAFSSINAAIAAAGANATIVVNPGLYHEAVNLSKTAIYYLQQAPSSASTITFDSLMSPISGVSPVVQLAGGVSFVVGDATSTTLYAPITGSGSFTKVGSGTLTLSAINSYNGATTITDDGVLRTGVAFALPGGTITILPAAKLQLGGINQAFANLAGSGTIENAGGVDATMTIGTGNVNVSFDGVLADGTGAGKFQLAKVGSGTFTLRGNLNSYTGTTTVSGGILRAEAANAFAPNSPFVVNAPGKVQLNGFDNQLLSTAGTGAIENGAATNATLTLSSNSPHGSSAILRDGTGGGTLAFIKAGTGTLTIGNANTSTYTGGSVLQNGVVVAGASGSFLGAGGVDLFAVATLRLGGFNVTINGLSGFGTVENASDTPATLTVSGALVTNFAGVIQDGLGAGPLSFTYNAGNNASNAFRHYAFANDSGNALFNLRNNGGMLHASLPDLTALAPTTHPTYKGTALRTGPIQFTDESQILADGAAAGLTDNYSDLWIGYLTTAQIGAFQFQMVNQDDWTGIWVDVNQDGIFQSTGTGLGSNQGEQLEYNDGGVKTVNLTNPLNKGYYMVAFTHLEGGGGANAGWQFALPGGSMQIVNPSAPAQAGLWYSDVPVFPKLTLNGANTYTGATTVMAGTLVAGSNTALGDPGVGTSVLSGGSLGIANDSTIAEPITANGSGAISRSGALVNIGGTNTLTGVVTAEHVDLGSLVIGSDGGTLNVGDVHLDTSNLTFGGSSGIVVNGVISGNLSGASPRSPALMSGLALWLDASDINANGTTYNKTSVSYWHDKSGNGHDLMNVYGHNASYVASSSNGKPAVAFDGGNALGLDYLNGVDNPQTFITNGGLNPNGQYTLVTVARYTGGNSQRIISSQTNQNWTAGFDGSSTNRWYANGTGSQDVGGALVNSNWHLTAMQNNVFNDTTNPANNYLLDGVTMSSASRGTGDAVITDNVPNGLQLGAWNGLNNPSAAQVSEVLMFNRVLSTLELQELERYLNGKYSFNSASLNAIPPATNNVTKIGSGTVTLTNANTYSGDTTINAGMLVAANPAALGTATIGTVVNSGGSLGLQGGITLSSEAITAKGTGASGQPGSIVNVSGANDLTAPLTLKSVDTTFNVAVGATAGTLTLHAIALGSNNLTFNGAGNVVVAGQITGGLVVGGSPTTSHLQAWFDSTTGVTTSGTTVTQWTDRSGNGHTATVGGNTSTLSATGPDGVPVVQFRNSWLNAANPLLAAETYVVFRSAYSATTFGPDWSSPFAPSGGDYAGGWMLWPGSQQFWNNGPNVPDAVYYNGTSIANQGNTFNLGNTPGVGQYMILKVDSNSANVHSTLMSLGRMNGWTNGQLDVAEVLAYDRPLTADESITVEAYLKAKYPSIPMIVNQGQNTVTKNGSGTVTLSGANTYVGTTAVNAGVLVAANSAALGAAAAGTTIAGTATLAFQNGVTIAEPLTIGSGSGAVGMSGTLSNVSGANTISAASSITLPQVQGGQLALGSLAGTLTIAPSIDLKLSKLVVDGSGDVTLNGSVSSSTPNGINTPLQADYILGNASLGLPGFNTLSFWQFNQASGTTAPDSAPANNTGTFNGGTHSAGWSGKAGDYALDTRAGGYVFTSNVPANVQNMYRAIKTNNSVTLGYWLWEDPTQGQRNNTTFQALQGGTRVAFTHAFWGDNNLYWDAGQGERVQANVPFANYTDGWHQYVMTKSSASPNYQAIYRDGVLIASGTGSQTMGLIDNLTIAPDYRGQLDDVFLTSRALTQADVTALWNSRNNPGFLTADNQLVKTGAGTLRLNGPNTYIGNTTVNGGALAGSATLTSNVAVNATATLTPGSATGASGSLSTKNLALASGANFTVDLNGTNSYDQAVVAGTVNLGGAALSVRLGYLPTAGTVYKIIDNDGTSDAVQGSFLGLAEGDAVTADFDSFTYNFRVSYVGGDGNDVTLTNFSLIPHVTGVAPFVGPTSGSNVVVITGSGFGGVSRPTDVQFSGVNALSFTVNSGSQITAVVPAQGGNPSVVNVRVTNGVNVSDDTAVDDYTYDVPRITSVVANGVAVQTLTGATWSAGNQTITVASTAGLVVGSSLSSLSAGFPVYATVTAITSPTTFTVNLSPTTNRTTATTILASNSPTSALARDGFGNIVSLTGQQSVVQHLLVTFNMRTKLDAGAFNVTSAAGSLTAFGAVPTTLASPLVVDAVGVLGTGDASNGYSQYVLTFEDPDPLNDADGVRSYDLGPAGSGGLGTAFTLLNDGMFSLNTVGSHVHAGVSDVGVDSSTNFWTLFGVVAADDIKVNGGVTTLAVDGLALNSFYSAFNSRANLPSGPPAYIRGFDRGLEGFVDGIDLNKLYANFGTIWKF